MTEPKVEYRQYPRGFATWGVTHAGTFYPFGGAVDPCMAAYFAPTVAREPHNFQGVPVSECPPALPQ